MADLPISNESFSIGQLPKKFEPEESTTTKFPEDEISTTGPSIFQLPENELIPDKPSIIKKLPPNEKIEEIIKSIKKEKEREEEYGHEIDELPDNTRLVIAAARFKAKSNGEMITSIPEPGVRVTKFGEWTETKINTYGGVKYNELSKEDQKIVDEYEKDMAEWEKLSDAEKKMYVKPTLPEDLEKETEVRIKSEKGELKTKDEQVLEKYIELSTEEKQKIRDIYEKDMAKWEKLSDAEKKMYVKPTLPEDLEKETEND